MSVGQTLDTAVPMLLHGPSTAKTEEAMFPEDAAFYAKYDKEGMKITGYPWAGDVYHVYATRSGTNPMTGEPARDEPLFGTARTSATSTSVRSGTAMRSGTADGFPAADANKDGRIDEIETMRWCDENRPGKGDFKDWTTYNHPQLGEVEIGGWNPKFWTQNPPPDMLETWAKNEAMFNLYLAQQLPQIRIVGVTVAPAKGTPAADQVFDVTATITNDGLLPTALEMAKRVKIVRRIPPP